MPFIPHTEDDVRQMLAAIGASSIQDLFDEIPAELRAQPLQHVPAGMTEMEVSALMRSRAREDGEPLCFIGAGAVVNRNVPDHALMVGNPAKQIGWACECGERLSDDLECLACENKYEKGPDGLVVVG